MMLTHQSCVGLVDRVERRGLARRRRSDFDGRRVQVELTDAGEASVEKLAAVHQAQLQLLGPQLIASLASIVESVQVAEASH